MTTTACDDQFAPEPIEPVRRPYDIVSILHRNVADLEIALRKQVERAESAEAELLAIREDNHAMMLEIDGMRTELTKLREQEPVACVKYKATGGNVGLSWLAVPTGAFYPRDGEKLYVSPIHAPAVPAEWREVMAELAADLQSACDAEHPHRDQYPSVMRKYNNDMEIVEKARALLQSADHSERNLEKVAPDCQTCANRGQVNGLSQESYCDSCIYQDRNWRQNHFVDTAKRRCEACAILPCSCK